MNRNPYVMLGIPFGSSREEANTAFARRARPLRRRGAAERDQLTGLTWALNQVDEGIRRPEAAMEIYRIPADPEAFSFEGMGVLRPPPEHLPAREGDREQALRSLHRTVFHEYLRYLVLVRGTQVADPEP
jgi:hypothetical protein